MFDYATSPEQSLYVGLYRGHSTDADYELCVGTMFEFEKEQRSHPEGVAFVLVSDPDVPPVPASWRKRMAAFNDSVQASPYLLSIVTPSPTIRGILTAINWISPPKRGHEHVSHATFEQARDWLEQRRGRPLLELRELYRKVRAVAAPRSLG
jgi:hypothetical protein